MIGFALTGQLTDSCSFGTVSAFIRSLKKYGVFLVLPRFDRASDKQLLVWNETVVSHAEF